MKQFFKILFASTLGAFLGIIILFVVGFAIIIGLSGETKTADLDGKNVLLIKNVVTVGEISTPSTPKFLSNFSQSATLGVFDILRALAFAKTDENISGIVLEDVTIDAGYETVAELTDALSDFRNSGKFVVGHFNTLSQKSYLLASACNEISMNAEGMAEFHGISSSSVHYKNLLEKVGLKPVVIRCGKYKSYVESVTNDKMSAENREQKQSYIDMVWKSYETMVIQNRPRVTFENLNKMVDSSLVCLPSEMYDHGFIDKIQFNDEFWNSVKRRMEINEKESVSTVGLRSYIENVQTKLLLTNSSENKIAVVVAQGSIDMGKSDEESIGSETYVDLFKKLRKDSTVKSIVFRINSGGGSALASELIWREVSLTAQEKPVVVSMGDMAASGGYYIATPATKIVASPMTLTGSIGVFGMSMTAENLLDKIGISIDTVNTHAHSDFGSISRSIDPIEIRAIQKSIDKTYATFKQRVSDGRNLDVNFVERIAQGRIWSGSYGDSNGLVDATEFGSLNMSMKYAVDLAGFEMGKDYSIEIYPKSKTLLETVYDKFEESTLAEKITDNIEILGLLKSVPTKSGVYTQIPYSITIK